MKLSKKAIKEFKQDGSYSPESINSRLDTGRDLIPDEAKESLSNALSLLPEKVIDFVIDNCIFISICLKCLYFPFDHPFFKDEIGFILLDTYIWGTSKSKRDFAIAHEVAHAYSKHKIKSSKEEMDKQEEEADILAIKWLSEHYELKILKRIRKEKK